MQYPYRAHYKTTYRDKERWLARGTMFVADKTGFLFLVDYLEFLALNILPSGARIEVILERIRR